MSQVKYSLPEILRDQLSEIILTKDNAELFCLIHRLLEANVGGDARYWVDSLGNVWGSEGGHVWFYKFGESSANGLGDMDENDLR